MASSSNKPLSIDRAWTDARAFIARDIGLLIPLVLTLQVVPGAAVELLRPATPDTVAAGAPPEPGLWMALVPIYFLLTLIASLAIARMALGGSLTVGEALRQAVRRLPVAAGATLLIGLAVALALLPVLPALMANARPDAGTNLYIGLLGGALFFLGVRMLLINTVIMAEPIGPIAAIRRAFSITRGHFFRLAVLMLLFLLTAMIVGAAVSLAGGAVFVGLGKMIGLERIGIVLLALLSGTVSAAISTGLVVMQVALYRQLASRD